ncbi:MAG: hypothetical protein KDI55_00260 [Anaerolineae bacterium]|nr:hypothetical protein [Anaerolineae bacterium]
MTTTTYAKRDLDLIWKTTHADYKSRDPITKRRSINWMCPTTGATVSGPIEVMPRQIFDAKLDYAKRKISREAERAGQIRDAYYRGHNCKRLSGPSQGACRVYVCIYSNHAKDVRSALKGIVNMQPRTYGGGANAIYVGYDNFSGIEIARGEAIATELQAIGIDCNCSTEGD